MKISQPHKRIRGFTLTELVIVVGIVGVILGAIWVAGANVYENEKVDGAVQEMHDIAQNMLTLYAGRPLPAPTCAGGNDITHEVINAGVIPSTYIYSNGPCKTAWHPFNTVSQGLTIGTNGATAFNIGYYGISLAGCISLVLQATACDPNQQGCPMQISVANGATSINPNAGPPKNWNLTLTQVKNLCNANTSPNELSFSYNL